VGDPALLGAADPLGVPAAGGDPPVQALGVLEDHVGAAGAGADLAQQGGGVDRLAVAGREAVAVQGLAARGPVAEPPLLGLHVAAVAEVGGGRQRHQPLHRHALGPQGARLGRVVGQQPRAADPGGPQDLRRLPEVAAVDRQAEAPVGVDGVVALVLEHVGLELGHQPDAAALVAGGVQQHPPALGDDLAHGQAQLGAAVAAQRPEGVAGQAGRVEADQQVAAVPEVAVGEHQVHLARRALEGPQVELPGPGRQHEAGDLLGLHHDGRISHLSGTQSPRW
jgi:hypothetical protein